MWEVLRGWRGKSTDVEPAESPAHAHMQPRTFSVNFKDLKISNDGGEEEEEEVDDAQRDSDAAGMPATASTVSPRTTKLRRLERNKLIIIMVGLPGRGKTFLCNKLVCYLNWLGHNTKLFNVGSYRRLQKDAHEVQDAAFFDKNNAAGMEARRRALEAALTDLEGWLNSPAGQVAIFDATNSTRERRMELINQFHGKYQYLFLESICTDTQVLEANYRAKMRYSPDYKGIDEVQALADFKARIRKYEEVYEPLDDRTRHYIKLIDMVTGRGHMDINRISGYIPGKIVFFLMQVCKAGMNQQRKIWLTRHGESEFNQAGRIGGNPGLSELGEEYARTLPAVLLDRLPMTEEDEPIPVSVWTSTLRRTSETAEYLLFPKLRWKALDEIHAGSCDGLTYQEISQRYPEEFAARSRDKLKYRYPAGESYLDVIQRLEPVIIELEREKECVLIVAHQAVLRALLGYFAATPLHEIPTLAVPLHTLIELQPRPDGTMQVEMLPVMMDPHDGGRHSVPLPSDASDASQSYLTARPSWDAHCGRISPTPHGPPSTGSYSGGGAGGSTSAPYNTHTHGHTHGSPTPAARVHGSPAAHSSRPSPAQAEGASFGSGHGFHGTVWEAARPLSIVREGSSEGMQSRAASALVAAASHGGTVHSSSSSSRLSAVPTSSITAPGAISCSPIVVADIPIQASASREEREGAGGARLSTEQG